jgi:hypothetical protein
MRCIILLTMATALREFVVLWSKIARAIASLLTQRRIEMRKLLFAALTFIGMSSAALAQPAVLDESQMDAVTAGLTFDTTSFAAIAVGGLKPAVAISFLETAFDSRTPGPP